MTRQKYIDGVGQVDYTTEEETEADILEQENNNNIFQNKLQILREDRNKLLADTDYYALFDVTMSDEMKTYRAELRDLTNGLDTVEKIKAKQFPTKPGA